VIASFICKNSCAWMWIALGLYFVSALTAAHFFKKKLVKCMCHVTIKK
jgi:hypothetical protein